MSRRTEGALLAAIVLFATALRLVRLGAGGNPTFHPALGSVLFVDELLQTQGVRGAMHHWTTLFSSLQGLSLVDRSVVAFPPAVLAQMVLGPSLALPAYVGTCYGVVGLLLAWVAARTIGGAALGLTFAALLAVSPVEIVWSRIGGIYIACVPHLLLGILCVQLAADRKSAWLALTAGAVAWLSLYNYYATRLVIPVGLAVLLVRGGGIRRTVPLVSWFLIPLVVGHLVWSGDGLVQTFWPAAGGGFIPPAERTTGRIAALAWQRWQMHWRPTLELLFTAGRMMPRRPWGWGLDRGGVLPLPVLLLGGGGFVLAIAAPRRHVAWLVLAVLGYASTALSGAEVRRLLPVDVAWNYLAALAIVTLAGSRLAAGLPPRGRAALVALGLIATGFWSTAAIATLERGTAAELAPIPFGGGLLGEAIMCRPCDERAAYWRDRIREGDAVVLVDPDHVRDRRIFRLGLRGYGMLAALEAGEPRRFMTACGDWQLRRATLPQRIDLRFDPPTLRAHLSSLRPRPSLVRFYFTAPAGEDRTLAESLRRLGGSTRPFARLPDLDVAIDAARVADAIDVLEQTVSAPRRSSPRADRGPAASTGALPPP